MVPNINPPSLPLEIAAAAGDSGGDKPTVDETVAVLVAHQVAIETAQLNGQVESLNEQLVVAKAAAEAAKAEFEAYKAEQARLVEVAQRRVARVAEVAKVAPALEATDARAERWAAMEDAEFASFLADLAAAAKPAGTAGETKTATAAFDATAGETAMSRTSTQPKASAATALLGL